jgi:hypothetical protein
MDGEIGWDVSGSDKHDRLRAWNLEAASTPHVFASQHVVDPYHIVARFLKAKAVLFVRPARYARLFGALQPADIIFSSLATMRATVVSLLNFLLLVKKILLVHIGRTRFYVSVLLLCTQFT